MKPRFLILSLALHGVVLLLMMVEWQFGTREFEKTPSAILRIDLTKVQIAEKTNLPAQAKAKPKATPKPTPTQPKPKVVQPPAPKPKEKPTPKQAAVAVEAPKKKEKKSTPKPAQKPAPAPKPNYDMKSLLASVEKVRQPAEPVTETTSGITNGHEGRIDQPLTISEKDLIGSKLRECWNIDAGAEGIEDIIIELRAYISRDGRVRDVKILNTQDVPAFQSVAESARRAIYICDGLGIDSPFQILSDKYGHNYQSWREIYLRFNPIDGGVF